jgi:hypothetical protein
MADPTAPGRGGPVASPKSGSRTAGKRRRVPLTLRQESIAARPAIGEWLWCGGLVQKLLRVFGPLQRAHLGESPLLRPSPEPQRPGNSNGRGHCLADEPAMQGIGAF